LEVFVGAEYFSGKEITACESGGITPNVPKQQTSTSKNQARYGKQNFLYLLGEDEYLCPAGQRLASRFSTIESDNHDTIEIATRVQ